MTLVPRSAASNPPVEVLATATPERTRLDHAGIATHLRTVLVVSAEARLWIPVLTGQIELALFRGPVSKSPTTMHYLGIIRTDPDKHISNVLTVLYALRML